MIGRMRVALAAAAACSVLLMLSGCSYTSDGAVLASRRIDGAAAALASAAQHAAVGPRDATFLIAESVQDSRAASTDVSYQPLTWKGNSGDADGAHFLVRLSTSVEAQPATNVIGAHNDAGSASRCYLIRVVIDHTRPLGTATAEACPEIHARTLPTPGPQPLLSANAMTQLEKVMATATAASLSRDVHSAFPAALSVPLNKDCVVVVKSPAGKVAPGVYDRTDAQIGETGCNTRLITNPAQ